MRCRSGVIVDRSFTFDVCCFCDLDLDSMTFIHDLDPEDILDVQIWTSYVRLSLTYRFSHHSAFAIGGQHDGHLPSGSVVACHCDTHFFVRLHVSFADGEINILILSKFIVWQTDIHAYISTDRHDRNFIPRRFAGGRSLQLVHVVYSCVLTKCLAHIMMMMEKAAIVIKYHLTWLLREVA